MRYSLSTEKENYRFEATGPALKWELEFPRLGSNGAFALLLERYFVKPPPSAPAPQTPPAAPPTPPTPPATPPSVPPVRGGYSKPPWMRPKLAPAETNGYASEIQARPITTVLTSAIRIFNVGNTCYLGSIVWCLANIRSFCSDLSHKRLTVQLDGSETTATLLKILENALTKKKEPDDPTPLLNKLVQRYPEFRPPTQQDPEEAFCCLLEMIEGETGEFLRLRRLERLLSAGPAEDWRQRANSTDLLQAPTMHCASKRNFSSVVQVTTRCGNVGCGALSHRQDVHQTFEVALPAAASSKEGQSHAFSLDDIMLDAFVNAPTGYKCSACGQQNDASGSKALMRPPRVLAIIIKRYSGKGGEKITCRVKVPLELDLTKYLAPGSVKCIPTADETDGEIFQREDIHFKKAQLHSLIEPNRDAQEFQTSVEWAVAASLGIKVDDKKTEEGVTSKPRLPDPFSQDALLTSPKLNYREDEQPAALYRLQGVIYHSGPNRNAGHYVSDARMSDGTWMFQNDAARYKVIQDEKQYFEDENKQRQAYMLFYVSKSIDSK
jgi:ubiquitin C-terminal hydrolase